jgi:hypothetical protein
MRASQQFSRQLNFITGKENASHEVFCSIAFPTFYRRWDRRAVPHSSGAGDVEKLLVESLVRYKYTQTPARQPGNNLLARWMQFICQIEAPATITLLTEKIKVTERHTSTCSKPIRNSIKTTLQHPEMNISPAATQTARSLPDPHLTDG